MVMEKKIWNEIFTQFQNQRMKKQKNGTEMKQKKWNTRKWLQWLLHRACELNEIRKERMFRLFENYHLNWKLLVHRWQCRRNSATYEINLLEMMLFNLFLFICFVVCAQIVIYPWRWFDCFNTHSIRTCIVSLTKSWSPDGCLLYGDYRWESARENWQSIW